MAKAIRVDNKKYNVGDCLPSSRIWSDNEPTDFFLDGTSGLDISTISKIKKTKKLIKQYRSLGEYIYIISGDSYSYGEDINELVIKNAVVLKIVKKIKW